MVVVVPKLVVLDSHQLTLWMNSDLRLSCSQVGRNLHDVASPHSWETLALIDEISNLAWQSESEPFLLSLCQQLWQRHAKFPDQYEVLLHWDHFCLSYA